MIELKEIQHVPAATATAAWEESVLHLKKVFLIKLTKALHIFGSPVHRTEFNMTYSCRALGVDGMFAIMPSMIIVTFGDSLKDPAKSETHILRVDQGLNCEKLMKMEQLADGIISQRLTIEQAHDTLNEILQKGSLYNRWIKVSEIFEKRQEITEVAR